MVYNNNDLDEILENLYVNGVHVVGEEELTDVEVCEDFLMFNMHNEDFLTDLYSALMGDEDSTEMLLNDLRETVQRLME